MDRRASSPDAHDVPLEGLRRIEETRPERGGPRSAFLDPSDLRTLRRLRRMPAGVVFGSAVYQIEIPYGAYFQNQELERLSAALLHARRDALRRMSEEARRAGADGVIGVVLEAETLEWSSGVLEMRARGTALVAEDGAREEARAPWHTTLNAREFAELHDLGMRPVGVVFGNCVFHVAHQDVTQTLRRYGENAELPTYSRALGGAREIATHRMEQAAGEAGAMDVVGVRAERHAHTWRAHVAEYLAYGDAVVASPAPDEDASPHKRARPMKADL